MPRNYGYGRASTQKQEASPETQRRIIEEYAATLGVTIDVWIMDPATSGKVPLRKRAGGAELLGMLKRGDTVWVAKIDRAFRSFVDFVVTVDRWAREGIRFKLCDMKGDFDIESPQGKAFLRIFAVFAEYEREITSARTKEGLATRKRSGMANGKYAGYGFKWEYRTVTIEGERRRKKFKVPDPDERQVMAKIAAWKLDGYDFEGITDHLRRLGIKTKEGREWSLSRVRRAYLAELQLQQDDAKAGVR